MIGQEITDHNIATENVCLCVYRYVKELQIARKGMFRRLVNQASFKL